jgi:N-acetylneuraminic acid mutarotase
MPTARDNLAAGVVNGILYTAGGCCVNFRMLKTFEAYDPSTDTWATKASMPTARDELAASGLDGKLYAVGGHTRGVSNTVEAYNPATDTWTAKASMPTKRGELATGVAGRVIYAVGGWNSYLRGVLHTNEAFNP